MMVNSAPKWNAAIFNVISSACVYFAITQCKCVLCLLIFSSTNNITKSLNSNTASEARGLRNKIAVEIKTHPQKQSRTPVYEELKQAEWISNIWTESVGCEATRNTEHLTIKIQLPESFCLTSPSLFPLLRTVLTDILHHPVCDCAARPRLYCTVLLVDLHAVEKAQPVQCDQDFAL